MNINPLEHLHCSQNLRQWHKGLFDKNGHKNHFSLLSYVRKKRPIDTGVVPDTGGIPDTGVVPDRGEVPNTGVVPDTGEVPVSSSAWSWLDAGCDEVVTISSPLAVRATNLLTIDARGDDVPARCGESRVASAVKFFYNDRSTQARAKTYNRFMSMKRKTNCRNWWRAAEKKGTNSELLQRKKNTTRFSPADFRHHNSGNERINIRWREKLQPFPDKKQMAIRVLSNWFPNFCFFVTVSEFPKLSRFSDFYGNATNNCRLLKLPTADGQNTMLLKLSWNSNPSQSLTRLKSLQGRCTMFTARTPKSQSVK